MVQVERHIVGRYDSRYARIVRKVFGDDVAMRCLVNRGHVVCPVRVYADRVVGSLVLNCI